MVLILWPPDTSTVKQRMIFTSSNVALRRSLEGVTVEIRSSDLSDVSYEAVLGRASTGA
ncbi:hypothetical protein [Streptomyces sp. NPDC005141]